MEVESTSDLLDDRNSNGEREMSDEAEGESGARRDAGSGSEETKRRIDPSAQRQKSNRRVRPKLDVARLRGPKGLHTVETYFKGFKYHGKGQEKIYLKGVMKRLEYWAHRIFPKYILDDFLEKIETLGAKKEAQVLIRQCRLGMVTTEQDVRESEDEDQNKNEVVEVEPIDAFDALINNEKPNNRVERNDENVAASVGTAKTPTITDEMKARIEANRKAAIERKLARERERLEKAQKNVQVAEVRPEDHPNVSNITDKSEDAAWEQGQRQELDNSRERPSMATPEFQLPEDNTKKKLSDDKSTVKSNEHFSSVALKSNASHMEEVIEETEGRSKENPSNSTDTMETSPAKERTVETLHRMERSYSPQDSRRTLEKASNDSERLLTHEELLEAIDGAMEEIIGKETTIRL